MYGFVTHTWNPIRGKCPHNCKYCYMQNIWKLTKSEKQIIVEKELLTDLGGGNYIFVGSSTDMWAESVPKEWIYAVLKLCKEYPKNTYLFQTKNPSRFHEFLDSFPKANILCSTIETNRPTDDISNAPDPFERMSFMSLLPQITRKSITIEPIIDFDLDEIIKMMKIIKPEFISIGADSKGHNLPEPSTEKIKKLMEELGKFTEVIIKDNLKRLYNVRNPNDKE